MEQLADKGDGFYAYVNRLDDARTLFGEQLTSTLDTVALDAKAQVEFNPDVVEAYRLVGYENRAIPDEEFRNDEVDAGAIGAGHAATALYALRLTGERGGIFDSGRIATVRIRWTDPDSRREQEVARDVHLDDLAGDLRGHRADVPARRDRGRRGRAVPRQPLGRRLRPHRRRRRRRRGAGRPAAGPTRSTSCWRCSTRPAAWNADRAPNRLSTALGPAGVVEERCRPADGRAAGGAATGPRYARARRGTAWPPGTAGGGSRAGARRSTGSSGSGRARRRAGASRMSTRSLTSSLVRVVRVVDVDGDRARASPRSA